MNLTKKDKELAKPKNVSENNVSFLVTYLLPYRLSKVKCDYGEYEMCCSMIFLFRYFDFQADQLTMCEWGCPTE